MADVKEILKVLVALQEKDCNLDKVREQATDVPKKIAEQNAQIAQLRTAMEGKKKKLSELQLKKKQKELELADKENEIKKHSNELNSVKSNDAYRALLIEIESSKQDKSVLETEILEVMEGIDAELSHAKENEVEFKAKEAEIKAVVAQLETEFKGVQGELAKIEEDRNAFAKSVPENVLRQYDFLRETRSGIAIAPLEGESCGGCLMSVRPQMINELCKAQEIVVCDSCQRILYKK